MVYRNTRQRQLVLDAIMQCDKGEHLNADSIYHIVRQQEPKISLGTVYRNLDILCGMGTIVKIKHGNSTEYYDKDPHPHYHFYCKKCCEIKDVEMEYNHDLDSMMQQQGYAVDRHRLIFDGICRDCLEAGNELS